MRCCGNKRSEWLQREALPAPRENVRSIDTQGEPQRARRQFEYIGDDALTLRGAASGATYRFAHRGDCLEVAYEDTFAMLAERNVMPRPPAQNGVAKRVR